MRSVILKLLPTETYTSLFLCLAKKKGMGGTLSRRELKNPLLASFYQRLV